MSVFERYQSFFGAFCGLVMGSLILGGAIMYSATRATPVYAAASDVKGSPNVAVAAYPVYSNGASAVVEVMADGSTKTVGVAGVRWTGGTNVAAITDPAMNNQIVA